MLSQHEKEVIMRWNTAPPFGDILFLKPKLERCLLNIEYWSIMKKQDVKYADKYLEYWRGVRDGMFAAMEVI